MKKGLDENHTNLDEFSIKSIVDVIVSPPHLGGRECFKWPVFGNLTMCNSWLLIKSSSFVIMQFAHGSGLLHLCSQLVFSLSLSLRGSLSRHENVGFLYGVGSYDRPYETPQVSAFKIKCGATTLYHERDETRACQFAFIQALTGHGSVDH